MLLTLLLLVACKDDAPVDSAPDLDMDQDGYLVGEDCDDHNPLANPAAPELCDGADNDCDGQIDEPDAVDARTWYVDADGDGAGTELVTEVACEAPPGFVAIRGDCDDLDERLSPLLEELCDGLDNDCDQAVDEPDAADARTWYPDADGDGYGDAEGELRACEAPRGHVAQAGDCDDDEAAASPAGEEVCDGVDNDCDGLVDPPEAADAALWYPDLDGDGFGVSEGANLSCEPPGVAWSDTDGDCDDGDGGVFPGAMELCDGVDQDCDGVIDGPDSADAMTWYTDGDGDGYGDTALAVSACEAPSGAVPDDGDCDDSDAGVNPDALEVCGDGVDNDCDGLSGPACGPGGVRGLVAADLILPGEAAGDGAGSALAPAGDVDGDGLDDWLIGAPGFDAQRSGDGAVWLVTSSAGGSLALADAAARISGQDGNDALGVAASGAGDLDGDGLSDIAVGAWANDDADTDAGAIYVFYGPVTGELQASDADATWLGEAREDFAGGTLAAAGDLDGDGWPELAVGAIGNDGGGDYAGAVFLLSDAGAGGDLADAEVILTGEGRNDRAGDAISSAGDVNGDGLDDLLVGALGDDDAGTGAGAAYLLHGPVTTSSSLSAADAKLIGEAWYDYAGDALAGGGDVDGDGYDDLLIGARSSDRAATDAGVAYVVLGPVASNLSLASADAFLLGEADYDYAGYDVAMPGDVNDDGFDDLLVGAHYEDSGGNAAGAAYLVLGPVVGQRSLTEADAKLTGQAADDQAGAVLSGAGDVDGDGHADLLIGAPGSDASGADSGGAYLILGGPGL